MKTYVDAKGNRYEVDRETGEKTLIRPEKSESGGATVSNPKETANDQEDV